MDDDTEPEPPVNLARRRLLRDIDRTARAMLEPRDPGPFYVVHPADAPALRAFLTGRPQPAYEPPEPPDGAPAPADPADPGTWPPA